MVYAQLRTFPGKWESEMQKDHLISARRLDLVIIYKKKRTSRIVDFAVPADDRVKLIENEKKDKYDELVRELKKYVEHESDGDTNCNWCSWYSHQKIDTGTGGLGNKRTSRDHPNYNIIKISHHTDKSPVYLQSLKLQWETIC